MFSDMPLAHTYSADEAKGYLLKSYQQNEWRTLLMDEDKKFGKIYGWNFKRRTKKTFGIIDKNSVQEALRLDRDDFFVKSEGNAQIL